MKGIAVIIVVGILQSQTAAIAQLQFEESGSPLISKHFEPTDYGGSPQNWTIVEDSVGFIYVGNSSGLLRYDGSTWTRIPGISQAVRSMDVGPYGTVYVGLTNDFGYLQTTPGELLPVFVSVKQDEYAVSNVWGTHVIADNVFFQTRNEIFSFHNGATTALRLVHGENLHNSFEVGDRLFVRVRGVGLTVLERDSLLLVPGGDFFRDEPIYFVDEYDDGLLIGSRNAGFFELGAEGMSTIETVATKLLVDASLYHGVRIGDRFLAFATLGGGVVFTDRSLNLVRLFDESSGLDDNVANFLYYDKAGGLWIAYNNDGISRMEFPSSLTSFARDRGLRGEIYSIDQIDKKFYVGTGAGLYELVPDGKYGGRYREFPGVSMTRRTVQIGNTVYAATEDGLAAIRSRNRIETYFGDTEIFDLELVEGGRRLLIAMYNKVVVVNSDQPGSVVDTLVEEGVRSLHAYGDDLWLARANGGLILVNRGQKTFFDATFGLPQHRLEVRQFGGDAIFVSPDGLYRPLRAHAGQVEGFVRDSILTGSFDWRERPLLDATADARGNLWLVFPDRIRVVDSLGLPVDAKEVSQLTFLRERSARIFIDSDVILLSSGDELFRMDRSLGESRTRPPWSPQIERISSGNQAKVLFPAGQSVDFGSLPFSSNDLSFEFTVPLFTRGGQVLYSTRLDGELPKWTDFISERRATFTNLREGTYTFRVKARNDFGDETPEASFTFTILPPWYRTVWAYLAYLIGVAILGVVSTKYYQLAVASRRAKEQAIELARERVLNEKLQEANDRLHLLNNRLTEVNALKDEFLATTSHELRTPITAIQGYAAILREELEGPQSEFAEIIDVSSRRLMQTLNAVLDLARLRSGAVDLFPVPTDLREFTASVVDAFEDKALEKSLAVERDFGADDLRILIDQYSLRNILSNVVDNAIKFSESGTVTVRLRREADAAIVEVSDEGVGVDADFLPFVYDEFRQESKTLSRERDGSGLGLSIVSRTVDLVGGSIDIRSQKDLGTTVTLTFDLSLDVPSEPNDPDHSEAVRSVRDRLPVARHTDNSPPSAGRTVT